MFSFLFSKYLEIEYQGHMEYESLQETIRLFSKGIGPFTFLPPVHEHFVGPYPCQFFVVSVFKNFSHYDLCVVVAHYDFNLHFPNGFPCTY